MFYQECRKTVSALQAAILTATIFFLFGCGQSTQQHLLRGEELLKQRKFQEAVMEFRAVADMDKQSAEAHWGLARAREGQGDIQAAVNELQQVILLAPQHTEAKVKLGNYYLLYNPPQIAEAEKLLNAVFAVDPNNIEGHILRASLLSAQNKPEEQVLDELQKAVALDTSRVESYLSLARFYMKTSKANEAEETIKKAISVNDGSPLGYIEYGRFFAFSDKTSEAEIQFKKAVEVAPKDLEARESLANFYFSKRFLDKAEQAYKDLAATLNNSIEGRFRLADFYSAVEREDDAINTLEGVLKDSPESARVRYRLGEIYLGRKETAKVNEQLEKLLAVNNTDTEALMLRARLKTQENKAEEAVADLQEILKKQPAQKDALLYMTRARLALGEVEQARAFIGDLEKYHPGRPETDMLKIQASFAAGENENALRLTNELLNNLRTFAPTIDTNAQQIEDLRVRTMSARGQANLLLGKINEARADLQEVLRLSPNSSSAFSNLAKVEMIAGNYSQALNLYEKSYVGDKKNFDALSGIVSIYKIQKQFSKAHETIDKALSAADDEKGLTAALHFLKADIFMAEGNISASEAELKASMQSDENYLQAYSAYADLLARQNKIDQAVEEYKKILEKKPSASTYTVLGMLEDARQKYDEAERNYRKALELEQNSTIAANNLAWIIAVHNRGNLDEALMLAQKTVSTNSSVAGFYDTLGTIFLKKGLPAPAIEQLKKAVVLDEAEAARTGNSVNSAYRVRLASALATAGDKSNARREAETALAQEKNLSREEIQEARNLLANL